MSDDDPRARLPAAPASFQWAGMCSPQSRWPGSWPLVAVFALLTAPGGCLTRRSMTPKQVGLVEIAATVAVALGALLTT